MRLVNQLHIFLKLMNERKNHIIFILNVLFIFDFSTWKT